ncbi:hypothetical protein [Xenophilus sp. Marseille-Q4582]|uniref:hypothetical protein n=1 Tax=Xenophilus sp. Marseille-Q4582 TaxID=2866600 RepID=UPI001CE452C4|nr:hypothetical protein [Xenophilus sp. Marseille-Q4582]
MDASLLSWLAVGAGLVLLVVLVVMQRANPRKPKDRRPRETQMVALVRRRRELTSQLAELAGDQSKQLLQAEARRLKGSASDIAVLEAAVARAERLSDRAGLRAEAPVR